MLKHFFSFESYGEHRELHSFPTRRSSDLSAREVARVFGVPPWVIGAPSGDRSEEHRSELQSRLQLVCGLLLEKKNKPKSCSSRVIARPSTRRTSPPTRAGQPPGASTRREV